MCNFVAIMIICLHVILIFMIGSLSIDSKLFIDGMWVVVLVPTAKTRDGATFHPLVLMSML